LRGFVALHVALFCYEGKKSGGDLVQAFNQNKMNLCSAVHHIASMGLYDVPVFGLVTDGYIGYATCAWGNKASETLDLSPGTVRMLSLIISLLLLTFAPD